MRLLSHQATVVRSIDADASIPPMDSSKIPQDLRHGATPSALTSHRVSGHANISSSPQSSDSKDTKMRALEEPRNDPIKNKAVGQSTPSAVFTASTTASASTMASKTSTASTASTMPVAPSTVGHDETLAPKKLFNIGIRAKSIITITLLMIVGILIMEVQLLVDARREIIQGRIDDAYNTLTTASALYREWVFETQPDLEFVPRGNHPGLVSLADRIPPKVQTLMLENLGMVAVGFGGGGAPLALQLQGVPPLINETIFVGRENYLEELVGALRAMFRSSRWLVRLAGFPDDSVLGSQHMPVAVELIFEEYSLRQALRDKVWALTVRTVTIATFMVIVVALGLELSIIRRLRLLIMEIEIFRKNPYAGVGSNRRMLNPPMLGVDEIEVLAQEMVRARVEIVGRLRDQERMATVGGGDVAH